MKGHTRLSFQKNSTSKVWMALTIFGIAIFAVLLPQLYDMRLDIAKAGDGSQGDPWTVCASGCDFTTLTATFASTTIQDGDYINVNATYATSTETFPLSLSFAGKTSVTIDCQNSGATIGDQGSLSTIILSASSTIQNCSLGQVGITLYGSGSALSGNTFSTSTSSTVDISADNTTVSSNTGLQQINLSNVSNTTITSNTIRSYDSSIKNLITLNTATSTLIQNNVLSYETPPADQFPNGAIYLNDGVSTTVSYNDIILESSLGIANQANDGIRVQSTANGKNVDATIEHNTLWFYQGSHTGINFFDDAGGLAGDITITANYNIFYNASSTASLGNGFQTTKNNSGSTYTLTNDYNGYYSIGTQIQDNTSDSFSPSVGSNSITDNPYFKLSDASAGNDTELAPFSLYLDVNGATDIGAYSAARGSSFTIDDDCTVDYSSCHGTSASIIANAAATNDTWNLAAGAYTSFSLTTSTRRTGSITIDGAGDTTIISASSMSSPISLTGLSSMTIQDVVVQNATSSQSSYTWTGLSFDHGGTSYNQTLALEFDSDGYALLMEQDCNVENIATFLPPSGGDVTSYPNMGAGNYHIALITVFGSPVTMIVPSSLAANQAAFEALGSCNTLAAWIQDAFTVSGGVYTYNSAAFASASVTVTSGYTDPPALSLVSSPVAGIRLINTTGASITNVTSTNNYYGFTFEGTAGTTNITDSVISSSVSYDIYSDSSGDNTLKNISFTRTSSTISGTGNVNVQFKTRAYIQNTSAEALGGVGLTFTSDDTGTTYSATTTDTGYTALSGYLSAFTMTSSSLATDNGGYNPYAVSVSATSTYAASSTAFTLDTVDETITATMIGAPDVPSFSSFTNTTSSIQAAWGAVSEAAYYTVSSTVPGFTSVTTTNTNLSYTDLDPATTYYFQIKSTNDIDLSSAFSSVTSTITDTPAALDPPTVSGFTNTTTSVQISWDAVSGATYYTVSSTVTGFETVTTTNTNYTYSDLDPATTYYFQTQTRDAYGQDGSFSSVTSTITDTPPPPSAPTISGFTNTTTTVQVSWGAVSGAAYYTVSSTADSAVTTTNTNYTFNSLDPATSYTFQVKTTDAYDQDSSYSSASSTVTETPDPLSPPTVTGFTNTTTSIQISWSAVSGATYYTVSSTAGTVTTTNTNYTFPGLDPATTYYFQTQTRDAYSQDGSFSSVTSTITDTPDPLAAPTVTGFTNTTSSIQISWDAVAGATYYTVSSTVTGFETVTTTNTNYTYSDLDPATTYYFQTQTRDAYSQDGSFSSVTSTITDTPPALDPPTVSGFSNTTTSIQISWSAVSGATYYTVSSTVTGFETVTTTNTNYTYVDLDPATTYYFQTQTRDAYSQDGDFSSVTSTITDTPPALAAPTVTGFTNTTSTIQVSWSAVTGATYYTVSSTVSGYETVTTTNTNYAYTGLDANTTYYFQTQTRDAYSQDGSFSSVTSTITNNHATPNAPTSFASSTITSTTIAMTWTDASDNETGFLFDYTSSTFPGVTSTIAANSTSKTTTSLLPNTAYTFRFRSENYTVASNFVTSSAIYTNPATPLSSTLSSNGQTSMLISWGANSNPASTVYEVYNVTDAELVTTTTQTSAYATGLTANTSYQFAVRAQYLSNSASYTSYTTSTSASTDAISSSVTMTLPVGTSSTFQLADGGETHTATVDSIEDGVVTMTIQTDPVVVSGSTGESDTIDSDGNGSDDIQITYDSVGSTSVDFTLASYTPPSSGSGESGSSGGAAIPTKHGPQTNDGKVITAASMYLGDNSGYTTEKTINVRFATNNAALIALSTDATFADAAYEPAKTSYELALPSAYGTYTVYAKLRSPEGGITVLSKKITYTTPEAIGDTTDTPTDISSDTCVLKEGKPYKAGNAAAVYYVTETCTKRPFQTAERYFEYFLSWKDVTVVDAAVLGAVANDPAGYMPHGPLFTPLVNTIIKATTDPKVYLFSGSKLHWIFSETVFNTLGYTWDRIEHVGVSILERFTRGEDLTQEHLRPNGTLIKYAYSPLVYRLEADPEDNTKQVKRWIHDEDTFISLHYRWQDIISLNEAEIYPNGENI